MTWAVGMPTVVLFDVDDTLIDSGGAGARSWAHAFDKLYGISADIGLVSGAMEGSARVKLSRADLNRFFVFGGYGSDSDDRAMLTRVAIDKATMLHGHDVTPDRVFVVGDTPLDVEAARAVGAVPVAVASGRFSMGELRSAAPDTCSPRWRPRSQR
jgi:phosphoglycolate phosphatase-like HAD superfamily hydrolase